MITISGTSSNDFGSSTMSAPAPARRNVDKTANGGLQNSTLHKKAMNNKNNP